MIIHYFTKQTDFLIGRSYKLKALTGLIVFILSISTLIAQVTVTGVVTDAEDNNEPLIGANVTIKDSSVGTVTDIDGSYTIKANQGDVLVYSYIGYEDQEIAIGSSTTMNVSLAVAAEMLSDVIVVGYGTVGKKDLTGVVTKVGEEEFNKGVITSPEKLLTGKVAGLQINSSTEPGGASKIRIRGGTSISASSEPLYVIDGVPLDNRETKSMRNPLNFLNASDIESITVLKDASAAAIYGSRGANGVIVVTTKSGSAGKLKVNYNGFFSASLIGRNPDYLSPNNFRLAIEDKAPQELTNLGAANTDWVDEITQLATGQKHNLSFSGAIKKRDKYFVSLGYIENNGVLRTSNNKALTGLVNYSTKLLNDNLRVNIKSKTGLTGDRFVPGSVMGQALRYDPTQPVRDADSVYGGYNQWDDPLAVNNPVSTLELTDEKGETLRSLNALNLEYQLPFLEGLSLTTNLSYDYTKGEKYNLKSVFLKDGETYERGGSLFTEEIRNYSALVEAFGTYKKELPNIRSKIEYTLGYSWQDFDRENRWTNGNGLTESSNEYGFEPTVDIKPDSFLLHNRLISFFTRLNYNFDEKYLVTLSLRRDGSTRFGTNNRWGLFPAVAVGWRILEEDFAAGLNNHFSNLKLRFSYGVTGNEDIEDFLFATFYGFGTSDAAYQFGSEYVTTLRGDGVDPNIKWEETSSLNVGLDFGVLNNRLNGSLEYYRKNTNDLLFTVATAAFTNLSDRILTNISELYNQGVELALDGYVIDRDQLDWNLGFNVAYNTNQITKLDNSNLPEFLGYETGGISGDIGQQIQILKVGESIRAFRTYQHKLDANGNPIPDTEDIDGDGLAGPLDIYEDINGDGIINENDLVVDKDPAPNWILGLTSNTNYKNFDLSFTLRSNLGNYVYNNVASASGYFELLSDRVTNNIPLSSYETNFKERQLKSNYYLENGSFLKLDNITLGYTLNKIKFFNDFRLYATAQNVLTLTKYRGLDPEAPQFNDGIDNDIFPVFRTFLFGLNASF